MRVCLDDRQCPARGAGYECLADDARRMQCAEWRIGMDNAVCICGCAPEDHESLGEDGEQCAHESDGHVCLRVAPAIRDLFVEMRERAEKAERERDEARKRVAELEAHLRKIHDRAHSWNSIPACSDIEQMAAQALGLKGGA